MSGIGNDQEQTIKDRTMRLSFRVGFPRTPFSALKKTRKARKRKMEKMHRCLVGFNMLSYYIPIYVLLQLMHEGFFTEREKERKNLTEFLKHNEIMTPTIFRCMNEFLVFVSELQTAAYSGSARTLRCILETAVEACDFQCERNRPTYTDLIETYKELGMREKKEEILGFFMYYNARASFRERYRVYERTKRIAPSFKELVNRLKSREMFREVPQISDDLKLTYERLSDYVHPSLMRLERPIGLKEISPHFDPKEFDTLYELGVKVLDIVQFLYIKAIAHFNGFEDAKKFLVEVSKILKFPSEITTSSFKLPFFKKISSGIRWKIAENSEKTTE